MVVAAAMIVHATRPHMVLSDRRFNRMTDYYDHGSENMMLDPTFKLSAHVEGMI